eukprot:4414391-Prymnesium_polylepis.2
MLRCSCRSAGAALRLAPRRAGCPCGPRRVVCCRGRTPSLGGRRAARRRSPDSHSTAVRAGHGRRWRGSGRRRTRSRRPRARCVRTCAVCSSRRTSSPAAALRGAPAVTATLGSARPPGPAR